MTQAAVKKEKLVARIDVTACKKCGICQALCPFEVFLINQLGEIEVSNPERCKGCGRCVSLCPDYAVTLDAAY